MSSSTRLNLNIGTKVRLKTGEVGEIIGIERPLGFREFLIRHSMGSLKVTAIKIDDVLDEKTETEKENSFEVSYS